MVVTGISCNTNGSRGRDTQIVLIQHALSTSGSPEKFVAQLYFGMPMILGGPGVIVQMR